MQNYSAYQYLDLAETVLLTAYLYSYNLEKKSANALNSTQNLPTATTD